MKYLGSVNDSKDLVNKEYVDNLGNYVDEIKDNLNNVTDLFSDGTTILSNALTDGSGTTAGIIWSRTGNTLTAQGTGSGTNIINWIAGTSTFPTGIVAGQKYIAKVNFTGMGLNINVSYKNVSTDSWFILIETNNSGEYVFTLPSTATYFRVVTKISSGNVFDGTATVEISNAIPCKEIKDFINTESFVMRGDVTVLGYTSLSSCVLPGVYTWSTSQLSSITDMPIQVTTGGFLKVFISNNRLWQEILSNNIHLIRYSASGRWMDINDYIITTYDGNSGADSSTEQIYIDIPNKGVKGSFIRYDFAHCVDATINCDVWRIAYLYHIDSDGSSNVMTRRGEFECALHLADRNDFSGGYVHGDEVVDNIYFFQDGRRVSNITTDLLRPICKEFKIVRHSYLYDPADNTTQIAEHGVEYIFTNEGVKIKQSVKWLGNYTLTQCYLAMFPLLKTYSSYRYDDTSFNVVSNDQTDYGIWINNAKMVCEFISSINSSMEITEYPTGLPGGDRARITDNGGESYNKIYFVICTSGDITEGTLWKSETIYRIV